MNQLTTPRRKNISAYTSNTPFWSWADQDDNSTIPEWQPKSAQLGWPDNSKEQHTEINTDYDEAQAETLAPEDQLMISYRVTRGKHRYALVPRTNYPHELSAVLVALDDDGDTKVDQYSDTLVYPPTSADRQLLGIPSVEPKYPCAFSTLDAAAAQDTAILAAEEEGVVRVLMQTSKLHRLERLTPTVPSPQIQCLPAQELNNLLALLDPSRIPIETEGFLLGHKTLEIDASNCSTFSELASAKTAGLNPSNCDASRYTDILDAMMRKEQYLAEESRIDEHGRPLTKDGNLFANKYVRGKVL